MAERTLNCCRHGKRANQECYECASGFDNASPYIEEIRTALDDLARAALDDLARAEADEGIYDRVPAPEEPAKDAGVGLGLLKILPFEPATTFGSLAGNPQGKEKPHQRFKTISASELATLQSADRARAMREWDARFGTNLQENKAVETCGNEFTLRDGYRCELPAEHVGEHEATCPSTQFHQTWGDSQGTSQRKTIPEGLPPADYHC